MELLVPTAMVDGLAGMFWSGTARLVALSLQPLTLFALQLSGRRGSIFDILWALVFGFATLNILGLVARRFEPSRNRLSFGEIVAIMTVVVSMFLLTWEMLYLFKVLPFRVHPF